ncbi:17369_t:CDS:2, partial [Cetraspora pellucida]
MNNEPIQSLIKDFSALLENSEDFDVKIKAGEEPDIKEFKAHSIILSTRSAYFKNGLSSRWARRENGIIVFDKPNISPSVFEVLINYIYTGTFSNKNDVSHVDIFIASDEIGLFEVSQQVEKRLLETESAWKFPNDFITICKHDTFTNLYEIALELADLMELERTLRNCIPHIRFFQLPFNELHQVIARYKNILPNNILDDIYLYLSGTSPKHLQNNLLKRESAYSFDSKIINATDAALIASWIDKKQGIPYRFRDMPFKFELIYRASLENFGIDKFHKNCDNKGPTVVIIKVRNSEEIIGGYNPLDWYEVDLMKNNNNTFDDYADYKFKPTSKSFVFSLISLSTGAIPRLSYVTSKNEAITWCKAKGPCFGFRDLWIECDGLRRSIVGTCKQHSYETAIIEKETFEIEEYE